MSEVELSEQRHKSDPPTNRIEQEGDDEDENDEDIARIDEGCQNNTNGNSNNYYGGPSEHESSVVVDMAALSYAFESFRTISFPGTFPKKRWLPYGNGSPRQIA